mgnify:CR=1 FL=1|jgi:hypothetical protein
MLPSVTYFSYDIFPSYQELMPAQLENCQLPTERSCKVLILICTTMRCEVCLDTQLCALKALVHLNISLNCNDWRKLP